MQFMTLIISNSLHITNILNKLENPNQMSSILNVKRKYRRKVLTNNKMLIKNIGIWSLDSAFCQNPWDQGKDKMATISF